jgi:lipoprotein-anchoring transpeptidase ErfK/SrfK
VHRVALLTLIASLHHPAAVFRAPSVHAWTRQVLPAYTPLSHQRTSLPVLQRHGRFLRVLLPGRPNSHSGWIRADTATVWKTPWRIVVKTGSKRLFALRKGRIVRSFPVVVGTASTPTPHGRVLVAEGLIRPARSAGAPDAYALSARSNVYQEFDGGPGQVAIHGTYGIGGTPGQAQSHGCIRASSSTLRWLIARMGTGTPVDIL